jgi:hypothetical protein
VSGVRLSEGSHEALFWGPSSMPAGTRRATWGEGGGAGDGMFGRTDVCDRFPHKDCMGHRPLWEDSFKITPTNFRV